MNAGRLSRLIAPTLAVIVLSPLLMPPDMNPGVVTLVASVGCATLGMAAAVAHRRALSNSSAIPLWAAAALALWLTARALASANPAVSFMGTVSQHSGAALWIVVTSWLTVTTLCADRRAMREILAVASLSGALFGALGIIEGLAGSERGWGSAAGPFENSSSLGVYLAIAACASLAWAFSARQTPARLLAGACGLMSLAGILAADSRAGLAGVIAGGAAAALVWAMRPGSGWRWGVAIGLPLAGMASTGLLLAAATSGLGDAVLSAVRAVGSERDAIWRSAIAQLTQAPFIGSGPEQFSAWVSWSIARGDVTVNGTYDPHNALVGIALAGGIVAVVLWLLFAIATLRATTATYFKAGRPRALAVLVAIPCALMGSALFVWLSPAAAVLVAALTGSLLAADRTGASDAVARRTAPRAAAAVAAVACAIVAVVALPLLSAEHALITGRPTTAEEFASLYRRWPDPSYASLAIDSVLDADEDPAIVEPLRSASARQARWHVDLALREIYATQRELRADPSRWPQFVAAVEAGTVADPASALWYTLAAAQADAEDRPEDRARFARAALALDPDPEIRALLMRFTSPR